MQLPNMQPMPQSNQTPSPAPMGGLQTIAPQSAAPQMNTPAPSPYPAPPTAPFAYSGAPPSSVNPSAQPPVVQQLSQQGRYGDSTLVHMNAEEVGGLQALAQSQGGSLTVNPQTGLPEAFSLGGFLKGLLPTLLGAGLSMIPGVGPLAAAGITAAGRVATGGSLSEGLQAGLGAYGGAGLGQSLAHAPGTSFAGDTGQATGMSGIKAMGSGLKNTMFGVPLSHPVDTPTMPANYSERDSLLTPSDIEARVPQPAMPSDPLAGVRFNAGVPTDPRPGPTSIPASGSSLTTEFGRNGELYPSQDAGASTAAGSATPGLWDRLKGVYGGARTAMAPEGSFMANHPNIAKYAISSGLTASGSGLLSALAALGAPGGGGGGGKTKEMYPYRGPYYPAERNYIPRENEDYSDTSEHLYFDPVSPMPSYYREPAVAPKKRNPFGFAAGGMTSSAAPSVFGASQTGTTSYGGQGGGQSMGRDEALALYNQIMAANAAKAVAPKGLASLPPPAAAGPLNAPATIATPPAPPAAPPASMMPGVNTGGEEVANPNSEMGDLTGLTMGGGGGGGGGMSSFMSPYTPNTSARGFDPEGNLNERLLRSQTDTTNNFDEFNMDGSRKWYDNPTMPTDYSDPYMPANNTDKLRTAKDYAALGLLPPEQGMVSRGLDAANGVPAWALSSMGPTGVALAGVRYLANRVANRNKPRGNAEGGMRLEDGAFIVDARTVSELGNGSSSAGQELLAKHGGKSIHGKGDGVSDSIRASIGGKQEARVARDEVKFNPQAVAKLGGGDRKRGTQKLYAMMDRAANARKNAKRGEDTKLRGLLGA